MGRFDLVIFDCDGVLVDSERLAVRTEAEVLFGLGWPLTETEIVERFVGRSETYMRQVVEDHFGRTVDWENEFKARYEEVFTASCFRCRVWRRSSAGSPSPCAWRRAGGQEKIRFLLGLTGLLEVFGAHLFSVDEVANGKPAPDVFLYAAQKMGVGPGRCAVVEDSVAGVTAGLAAEMTVFAFAGGVAERSTAFHRLGHRVRRHAHAPRAVVGRLRSGTLFRYTAPARCPGTLPRHPRVSGSKMTFGPTKTGSVGLVLRYDAMSAQPMRCRKQWGGRGNHDRHFAHARRRAAGRHSAFRRVRHLDHVLVGLVEQQPAPDRRHRVEDPLPLHRRVDHRPLHHHCGGQPGRTRSRPDTGRSPCTSSPFRSSRW